MWLHNHIKKIHLLKLTEDAFIQSDLQLVHLSKESERIYRCRYSKDVHGTKCKAPTTARLTHSPCTTKIARIRCYTTKYYNQRPHTISVYIKFTGSPCRWERPGVPGTAREPQVASPCTRLSRCHTSVHSKERRERALPSYSGCTREAWAPKLIRTGVSAPSRIHSTIRGEAHPAAGGLLGPVRLQSSSTSPPARPWTSGLQPRLTSGTEGAEKGRPVSPVLSLSPTHVVARTRKHFLFVFL